MGPRRGCERERSAGKRRSRSSMRLDLLRLLLLWLSCLQCLFWLGHLARANYINEWALEIPGGREVADQVARELGYRNLGQVSVLFLCVLKSFQTFIYIERNECKV